MAIELPRAHPASAGTGVGVRPRPRVKLPNAGDVPQKEQGTKDPGLDVPDFAKHATGLSDIGAALGDLAEVAQRARNRSDAVDRARTISTFNAARATELQRIKTEEDLSSEDVTTAYMQGGRQTLEETLAAHTGSEDSRARLAIRLEAVDSFYADQAARAGARAGLARVEASMGEDLNNLVDNVSKNPGILETAFESLDAAIEDMAPALTAEQESDFQVSGREALAKSAVNSFLDRGLHREARAIMEQTPGLASVMSPETQRILKSRIAVFERVEANAATAGARKLNELETILGRKATPAERVRAAGVEAPAGRQTPASKIDEMEAALGRPLTDPERERVAGLEQPAAVSPEGKVVQDRNLFVEEFGEDSAQVVAFDEATQDTGPPSLADVAGQRKEFTKLSLVFVNVRDSFNRVVASAQNPTAAGDLAMIFNYMKILDPGSVVRESEFAQAAATGSFTERLKAAAERLLAGKRLSDVMRADFRERAELLMQVQARTQLRLEAQFRDLAVRSGLDPAQVVIDFIGPFRAAVGGQPLPDVGDASVTSAPKPRFKVDLEGNIIGGP